MGVALHVLSLRMDAGSCNFAECPLVMRCEDAVQLIVWQEEMSWGRVRARDNDD